MLYYAVFFLILAVLAGLFSFGVIASAAVGIAKILFWIFIVAFVASLALSRMNRR